MKPLLVKWMCSLLLLLGPVDAVLSQEGIQENATHYSLGAGLFTELSTLGIKSGATLHYQYGEWEAQVGYTESLFTGWILENSNWGYRVGVRRNWLQSANNKWVAFSSLNYNYSRFMRSCQNCSEISRVTNEYMLHHGYGFRFGRGFEVRQTFHFGVAYNRYFVNLLIDDEETVTTNAGVSIGITYRFQP